jgi:hypothetical protein
MLTREKREFVPGRRPFSRVRVLLLCVHIVCSLSLSPTENEKEKGCSEVNFVLRHSSSLTPGREIKARLSRGLDPPCSIGGGCVTRFLSAANRWTSVNVNVRRSTVLYFLIKRMKHMDRSMPRRDSPCVAEHC